MNKKDRIEGLLCFDGKNNMYHINDMIIVANKFDIEENIVKFYTKTLDYRDGYFCHQFTFSAFIPIDKIRTIDGIAV